MLRSVADGRSAVVPGVVPELAVVEAAAGLQQQESDGE